MSYQVLALKWRPRSFQTIVGQKMVVQALTNALNQHRIHHAYLFTGTRGVGKTTLARLLAKCLNCETGITSNPCERCSHCVAIDQGRFMDLLEIDAASRTKVEDTRDLLDNVQYAPTQGRFKVYLIDEVHMLSNHSFNALLKTLEEPPPHVKFLLATTDPQRLPVTILSRCLQFHLKNLSHDQIVEQLQWILNQENLAYEAPALHQLAQAAQGSMRDALSLLDQAIAYGGGKIASSDVLTLLGGTQPELLIRLLEHLGKGEAKPLLDTIDELASVVTDWSKALEELLSLLHQMALCQAMPDALTMWDAALQNQIMALTQLFSSDKIQSCYQMALIGRRDLPLAPTPRSGFEMLMLRMLVYSGYHQASKIEKIVLAKTPKKQEALQALANSPIQSLASTKTQDKVPSVDPATEIKTSVSDWTNLLKCLNLHGPSHVIASNCVCIKQTSEEIHLVLDKTHALMFNKTIEQRIAAALQKHLGRSLKLKIDIGEPQEATPALLKKQQQEEIKASAVAVIAADTQVQSIIQQFDAHLIPHSVMSKNLHDKD